MRCAIQLTSLTMNPKVSIIVAAYNIENFIEKCLESIQSQTYQNIEIIIVDDGSTDGTAKYCDDFCETEPRARVIHQKNKGLSEARNVGIKESTSEFITFVDGDDMVAGDYVKKLLASLIKNDSDIAVCGFTMAPSNKSEHPKNETISGEDATIKLLTELENYQIVSWNKIYKKSLFIDIKFPAGKKHEDSLTTYRLFAASKKVSFISDALYYYIKREDSIMNSEKLKDHLNAKLDAASEVKKYFKDNKKLFAAAEISELLAYNSFLDNIYSGRLKESPKKYIKAIKKNRKKLFKNEFITKKLLTYVAMETTFGGIAYKTFRKIKN